LIFGGGFLDGLRDVSAPAGLKDLTVGRIRRRRRTAPAEQKSDYYKMEN